MSWINSNLLYLFTLSPLAGAPVLIWVELVPTARSAINVSSVSPDLWLMIVSKLLFWASLIFSIVSLTVPTWFNFISIEFPAFSSIPLFYSEKSRQPISLHQADHVAVFSWSAKECKQQKSHMFKKHGGL